MVSLLAGIPECRSYQAREEESSLQERIHSFSVGTITELNIPHSHAFAVSSANSRFQKLLCEKSFRCKCTVIPKAFNFSPQT